jgi:AcrR family transcriptional regulator
MPPLIEEPQNARSRRTSAALLDAARSLIESQGFEALTMSAVAERAGVSRRGSYLHFASRTELVMALYRSLGQTEELAISLQKVWDSPDAVAAVREWAHHIARSHPRILAILRAVEGARHTDPDANDLWQTTMRNWRKGSGRLVEWLTNEGRLAPQWTAETATDMVWALMSLDILERLIQERRWSKDTLAANLSLLLETTFVAPADADPLSPEDDHTTHEHESN